MKYLTERIHTKFLQNTFVVKFLKINCRYLHSLKFLV